MANRYSGDDERQLLATVAPLTQGHTPAEQRKYGITREPLDDLKQLSFEPATNDILPYEETRHVRVRANRYESPDVSGVPSAERQGRAPYGKRMTSHSMIACPSLVLISMTIILTTVVFVSKTTLTSTYRSPFTAMFNSSHGELGSNSVILDLPSNLTNTCKRALCKSDADYFKDLISWELDPCDNFYRFVCQRWKSPHVEEGSVARSVHGVHTHQLEIKVRNLLLDPVSGDEFHLIRAVYHECMNKQQHEKDGWTYLQELLSQSALQGFPFSTTGRNTSSVWQVAAKLLRNAGVETLLALQTIRHPFKSNDIMLAIQASKPISPNPNNKKETSRFYSDCFYAAWMALREDLYSPEVAQQVVAFAVTLEFLSFNATRQYCPYQPDTLKANPYLLAFLLEMFSSKEPPVYIGMQTDVVLRCPDYIEHVGVLVTSTKPHIALNYLGIRLMIEMSAFAPSSGGPLMRSLAYHLYGRSSPPIPRWRLCIRIIEYAALPLFLHAVRHVYLDYVADNSILHFVMRIVSHLYKALSRVAILDEDAKSAAQKLLNLTRIHLFHPAWVSDRQKLRTYSSRLANAVNGKGMTLFYRLRAYHIMVSLQQDPGDHWLGSAFDRDCHVTAHALYVPVLMFNFSRFDLEFDKSLRYPGAGFKIMRCLLHTLLHNLGTHQNVRSAWWPELSESLLRNAELCFYRYAATHWTRLTLLESTAALQPSLELYAAVSRPATSARTLTAFDEAHLFFVYHTLGYCEEASGGNRTESDDTPNELEANVPLLNSRTFQETYSCAVGTRMNPLNKCVIWRQG
ncbi:neprilysin-1-like [Ornithodoros turicata]|uniref:neprilysin-1-like n=1 Tax=Ornithodoros turicata TaxID=34597 RepID=UPI0031396391